MKKVDKVKKLHELQFLSPVPGLGDPYWHGASMGMYTSQFHYGAKNQAQSQHWASASMTSNIYI